ncbi:4Fe-4S dicluster domain-containing protein [Candidatus Methylocalor cossyra]|uniref:Molybdopterin oxidoreductase n=1 Tax=Candidatus Methylocalor cossyra TaxID=3108543 RepID=A0ABM9NFN4_9GAMM
MKTPPTATDPTKVQDLLWRGLDEPGAAVGRDGGEFPDWTGFLETPMQRRRLLKLMAASLVLGGAGGCGRPPKEEIVPYVRSPEQLVPGRPAHFATALTHAGYAQGVVVESHEGRPTKVEGNALHPASLGATDIFAQAALLDLYDPDRSQTITNGGKISALGDLLADLSGQAAAWTTRRGAGVCLLTPTVTSPTLAWQLAEFFQRYPEARWVQHEPVDRGQVLAGAQLAFGREADTLYRFDRARVILSLDSDFLTETPARSRYGHDFVVGRRTLGLGMNRLYALESTPGLTGAMADHRLPLPAGRMEAVARALAGRLGLAGILGEPSPVPDPWLDAVASDLAAHPGESAIVAGEHLPPAVHALVQAMNQHLGNFGRTVIHIEPVAYRPADAASSLTALAEEMHAGRVEALIVLGGNPVYTAPRDLDFPAALRRVPLRIHHGLHADETAALCHWHIPALHELESWTDVRAYDGTVSLVQPLLAPLYQGHSAHQLLALLLGQVGRSDRDLLKSYWRARHPGPDFDHFWRAALRDGVVPDSANPPLALEVLDDLPRRLPPPVRAEGLELRFRPDPCVYDGRYANNGWLQELPKPLSKLTWDNPALVGPALAERLGLTNGDWIELSHRGRQLRLPVWVMPGQPEQSVALHLGYGRMRAGAVGDGAGYDSYALRTAAEPWFGAGLRIQKAARRGFLGLLDGRAELASTQHHATLDGRDLVRVWTKDQPPFAPTEPDPQQLYPQYAYPGHAWAMVIDLNACIGCNACVVACQAENNVPIVGKAEVLRGREMHWLRVDRYYAGAPDNPETYFQPVPCMQCEQAPCEPVCPVQASIHDTEGINNQVYNRCVGTRFCQSNCPYKVRRFNFFDYAANPATHEGAPITAAVRNPDVTVRSRGVMEKCTYCIQRINAARLLAEEEQRPLRDGEVQTACQQACPTQAIVFGDRNAPASRVAALRREPRHYALLEELNTRPRTTYLARLRNPHPDLGKDSGS